jgi:hypothetical protein
MSKGRILGITLMFILTILPSPLAMGDCSYWSCYREIDRAICGVVVTAPEAGDKWAADCTGRRDCDPWSGICGYWCDYDLCYDV